MDYSITDHAEALDFWLDIFVTICDKQAPYNQTKGRSLFLNQDVLLKNYTKELLLGFLEETMQTRRVK